MRRAQIGSSEISPYLFGSLLAHAAAFLVLMEIINSFSSSSAKIYTIDFVGPSSVKVAGLTTEAAAPKNPAGPAAQAAKDLSFAKRHQHFSLPKPSLLDSNEIPKKQNQKSAASPSEKQRTAAPLSAPAASANVFADLPNFPYPWYISELRAQLWGQWSKNLPDVAGECGVVFEIMPDGRIVDLRTQSSSGDPGFDLAALSAVKDASPFPPLPQGFHHPFLKIHLTLKSQ